MSKHKEVKELQEAHDSWASFEGALLEKYGYKEPKGGMDVLEMDGQKTVQPRRKEGRKQCLTTFGPVASLFLWHMPKDVRFGGGGCRDVTCQV